MSQEDKELLIKDLCGRLPYGVKLDNGLKLRSIDVLTKVISCSGSDRSVEYVRPYLRPMSSMTEEEVKEIQKINWQFCKPKNDLDECFVGDADDGYCSVSQMVGILNYLNAHHFDYRGLIERRLALEAPEGMYKI